MARHQTAGDDLKSILDLQARQRLRTDNDSNKSFDFDFDETRTELSVTLDTPLNDEPSEIDSANSYSTTSSAAER